MMTTMTAQFEHTISQLTQPLNGQYPRPWMTKLISPLDAEVFIVGKNQRNGYDSSALSHERHMDALFNRNGETCRKIYDEITSGNASPTRKNTDRFVQQLESRDVTEILETNVICYSSPMSADLRLKEHAGGTRRGEEIFRYLLQAIQPKVLIVHGTGSTKNLASILKAELGPEPESAEDLQLKEAGGYLVAVIPSLAPPAFNKWSRWSVEYLTRLSSSIAEHLKRQ
jgi:hypothetical protein